MYHGDDGLTAILEDKSIQAVAIILPVHASPQVCSVHASFSQPSPLLDCYFALIWCPRLCCQNSWSLAMADDLSSCSSIDRFIFRMDVYGWSSLTLTIAALEVQVARTSFMFFISRHVFKQ